MAVMGFANLTARVLLAFTMVAMAAVLNSVFALRVFVMVAMGFVWSKPNAPTVFTIMAQAIALLKVNVPTVITMVAQAIVSRVTFAVPPTTTMVLAFVWARAIVVRVIMMAVTALVRNIPLATPDFT